MFIRSRCHLSPVRGFIPRSLRKTKDTVSFDLLGKVFFKESQEPKSKANEDHSREWKVTAGTNGFLALLRKGSDPKSEEVGRVIIGPQYS